MFRPENIRYRTYEGDGYNGQYRIPHYKISDYFFFVVATSGMGWEHVSVSLHKTSQERKVYKKRSDRSAPTGHGMVRSERTVSKTESVERCPTWEEMCFIKDFFWTKEDAVIQYHPPKSDNVSLHPYCLHLWRPTDWVLPVPDPILVGIPGADVQSF